MALSATRPNTAATETILVYGSAVNTFLIGDTVPVPGVSATYPTADVSIAFHGVASGATISNGVFWVGDTGKIFDATLKAGGRMLLYSAGGAAMATASGTVISSGGIEWVKENGSTDTGAIISSGGYQQVLLGGRASGTMILSGGLQVLLFAGAASGAIISNGGLQDIFDGAGATDTTIYSGGIQKIWSGGFAERGGHLKRRPSGGQIRRRSLRHAYQERRASKAMGRRRDHLRYPKRWHREFRRGCNFRLRR